MQIRPTLIQPRLTPSSRPAMAAEAAAPEAVAKAVATALPASTDLADRLLAGVVALLEAVKEKLRPTPPVLEPSPAPVTPSPAPVTPSPAPALPKPKPRPRFTPQPKTPFPRPTAPSIEALHASRADWFFSQYESKTNPNEDASGNANCGPTTLTMVAKAFGKIDPTHAGADAAIEESRRRMRESQDEMSYTSTVGLARGAQSYGLKARRLNMRSLDQMRQELDNGKLLIANVVPKYLSESNTGGHFAVVTAIKDGKVHLNDPASKKGPITISEAEFKRALEVKGSYAFVSISA